jgi:hypothetical protein
VCACARARVCVCARVHMYAGACPLVAFTQFVYCPVIMFISYSARTMPNAWFDDKFHCFAVNDAGTKNDYQHRASITLMNKNVIVYINSWPELSRQS